MRLTLVVILGLVGCTAVRADINYDLTTTLSLVSGSDVLGLNGAVVNIKVDVSSTAVYGTQYTYTAVEMNDDATVTISGSSYAANNNTFDLPQLLFFPGYEGAYSDLFAGGNQVYLTLPVGGSLLINFSAAATTTGLAENSGDTIQPADFGLTSDDQPWYTGSMSARYNQVNPVVTVTSTVPEPSSLVLLLTSLCGAGLLSRRRR